MGDGVLASFSTVTDAVYCAAAIQKTCEDEPDLKLRIGIHQGEVVFDGEDVFGSGVNIASRLEPLAPVGGILVSESVHRNLGNKKGIVSTFIREEQLKNVKEPIRIYSVKGEDVKPMVIPQTSIATQQLSTKSMNPKRITLAVAGVLVILLLSYLLYSNFKSEPPKVEADQTALDKSIAVLPFTDLSPNKNQEYFSDGMMEEILNHLVKIQDLKVISRTTAMRYKETAKSVSEIAKELGVAAVLEGSVRKDGNQLRITVQLIEGATDVHLWSESYDREMTNIFQVQSDVAKRIAQVLQAEVSPEVRVKIESQPTSNPDAYNESDKIFKEEIQKLESIDHEASVPYLHLSRIYAFKGDRKKALENLNEFAKRGFTSGWHDLILIDPFFESLRDDPEFKAIVKQAQEEKAALRKQVREMESRGELDFPL